MVRPALIALILAAGLTGCTANDNRYPSLLPRAIESQSLAEPERPAPVAAPDAALDARIAALVATLDKASKDFTAAAQDAEARIAVARGLPEGSEGWLDAQAALSAVGAAGGPVATTLAALEEIAIERGQAGLPPYPALDAAVARAGALAEAQSARSATLEAALASR
ncbi:MAG: hypothetical protein V4574_15310 [Pseudomonadota bacterium]